VTNIPYLDEVWNLTRGCTKVSAGCRSCYADRLNRRFKGKAFDGTVELCDDKMLERPLHWRRPRRVGVCFMSDLFHEAVPDGFLDKVFAMMALTPQHTYVLLTKRPERMRGYLGPGQYRDIRVIDAVRRVHDEMFLRSGSPVLSPWPLPNVWLGVSVENQETADERIPILLETPAAHRWVSAEPLLGAVDLHSFLPCGDPVCEEELTFLNWVVVGGESGPHSRQMEPYWLAQGILDCQAAGVPVYCKQDSGPRPGMQGRISDALWAVKQLPGGWA